MPKVTMREKFITVLIKNGWKREKGERSSRYIVFNDPICGTDRRMFVGRAGAVRKGRTIKGSWPIDDRTKDAMLRQYDEIMEERKNG